MDHIDQFVNLKYLMNVANIGMFKIRNDGEIVQCNRTATTILDIPECIAPEGFNFYSYLQSKNIQRIIFALENFETSIKSYTGIQKTVLITSSPEGDDYIIMLITDITERKEIENKLEFERNMFKSFIDHVPATIYFKDLDSRFVEVNKKKVVDSGMTKSELLGKTDFDTFCYDEAKVKFDDEQSIIQTGKNIIKTER